MASILGEAWVEIRAPLAALGRDLSRAQGMVDRSAGAMSTRMGRMGAAMSSLGTKMTLGLTLPIIGYMAVAVKAAADAERVTNDLNNALKATGSYTAAASTDLQHFAAGLQEVTVYHHTAIEAAMTYAIQLKGNSRNIKEVTTAAVGLAHMFKMDLQQGMVIAARGSEGIAVRLMRLGIKLKAGASDTEIWAAVSKKGAQGVQAAMSYAASTAEGQMAQLGNTIRDINESIGKDLLPTLKTMTGSLRTIANIVGKMPSGWKLWGLAALASLGPVLKILGGISMLAGGLKLGGLAAALGGGAVRGAAAAGTGYIGGAAYSGFLNTTTAAAGGAAGGAGLMALIAPALPIIIITVVTATLAYLGNRWGRSLAAGMKMPTYAAAAPLPSWYHKGEIRRQEEARFSSQAKIASGDIKGLREDLKKIIENTGKTADRTGRYQ